MPIDTVHYSPGFVAYGTTCGEDVDPGRVRLGELEQEVQALRRELAELRAERLPAEAKAKRA